MPSLIDGELKQNFIANGLSGPIFQAAIENRGVFEESTNMAGAMYICTGNTISVSDPTGTYYVPEIIAVEGPDEQTNGDYCIHLEFNSGHVSSAKLKTLTSDT